MFFVGVLWLALLASTMPSASATDVVLEEEDVVIAIDVPTLVGDLVDGVIEILLPIVAESGYACYR